MVEISVSQIINIKAEKAYKILTDISKYHLWWGMPINFSIQNLMDFSFSPFPLVKITLRQINLIKNTEIEYLYVKGPFRGTGKWIIEKFIDGNKVKITYSICLIPINKFYHKLSKTKMFARKHVSDILKIIKNIEKHEKKSSCL